MVHWPCHFFSSFFSCYTKKTRHIRSKMKSKKNKLLQASLLPSPLLGSSLDVLNHMNIQCSRCREGRLTAFHSAPERSRVRMLGSNMVPQGDFLRETQEAKLARKLPLPGVYPQMSDKVGLLNKLGRAPWPRAHIGPVVGVGTHVRLQGRRASANDPTCRTLSSKLPECSCRCLHRLCRSCRRHQQVSILWHFHFFLGRKDDLVNLYPMVQQRQFGQENHAAPVVAARKNFLAFRLQHFLLLLLSLEKQLALFLGQFVRQGCLVKLLHTKLPGPAFGPLGKRRTTTFLSRPRRFLCQLHRLHRVHRVHRLHHKLGSICFWPRTILIKKPDMTKLQY